MTRRALLLFAAVVEVATGLALILAPALVVALLLGLTLPPQGMPAGRVAGAAMLGLGLAAWPARRRGEDGPAFRGMLLYNVLLAGYLAHLGFNRHLAGLLLWPAVALHAAVTLALLWTLRGPSRARRVNG